jgi:hypothetical protein
MAGEEGATDVMHEPIRGALVARGDQAGKGREGRRKEKGEWPLKEGQS